MDSLHKFIDVIDRLESELPFQLRPSVKLTWLDRYRSLILEENSRVIDLGGGLRSI